jgi:hypothetical protein
MDREEYLAIADTISGLRQEGEGDTATLDLVVEALAEVLREYYVDFDRVRFLNDTSYEGGGE